MTLKAKLRGRGLDSAGLTRAAAVLLVLIVVMLVLIAIPGWNSYRFRAEKMACVQALKSARDGLIIDFLGKWDAGTAQDARNTLDEVMPERANLCPAGGTVYLVRDENGIFDPICGLHDPDDHRRVRLNASRAMELLQAALRDARSAGEEEPQTVEIQLNGKTLACMRVTDEPELRWGTKASTAYKGTVALFGVAGEGTFGTEAAKAGELCCFVYAEEESCAVWHAKDGWTGDAYANAR